MAIKKLKIQNFKCFQEFELVLNKNSNIIAGNNDTGKSTILEAINLAISGWYRGKYISSCISEHLFNYETVDSFLNSLNKGNNPELPRIKIEIYIDKDDYPMFRGTENSNQTNTSGFSFILEFDENYKDEYEKVIESESINSLPIEYYNYYWQSFARDERITPRTLPLRAVLIDSSEKKYRSGSDIYISKIIKDILEPNEIVSVAKAHRMMKEYFISDNSIIEINERLSDHSDFGENDVSLSVELNSREAWKNSLATYVNSIPFQNIGKGNQNILKTSLSLNNKNTRKADVILLEELENHLSFSNLNYLLDLVLNQSSTKQKIITTHDSYVANKLGLDSIQMLNNSIITKFEDLDRETYEFFKKLPGYDTLRLLLCERAILVEGDSDELIVQRAYLDKFGKLPIQDRVDVISVGLSFERFIKLAQFQQKDIVIVTDNDGDPNRLNYKYQQYEEDSNFNFIACYDQVIDEGELEIGSSNRKFNYNTLEPKLLKQNNLELFNDIFDTEFDEIDRMHIYMYNNKTDCALSIFNSDKKIDYPEYIMNAIEPFDSDE